MHGAVSIEATPVLAMTQESVDDQPQKSDVIKGNRIAPSDLSC
jgi:hypothetical protein